MTPRTSADTAHESSRLGFRRTQSAETLRFLSGLVVAPNVGEVLPGVEHHHDCGVSRDVIVLMPEFEIRHENASLDEWLRVWGVRADDALAHEDYTPSYGAAVAVDQLNQVLIFERYEGGEDGLRRHMARRAHDQLVGEMSERQMTKRRVSMAWLNEIPDWGRWTPANPSQPSSGLDLTVIGFSFPDDSLRHEFIESSRARAAELADLAEVRIIGATAVTKLDNRRPELRLGDVMIIAVSDDRSAVAASTWDDLHNGQIVTDRAYRVADVGYFWK